MTRARDTRLLADTRGLTLVELMVALVIVGIMGIAMVGFLRTQHQTVVRQNSGVLATQNARAAVDMFVRELRNAGYNPRGALSDARIQAMDSDSIAWTADMNADGDMVDVGAGQIDFAALLATEAGRRVTHLFVEHDEPADAFRSAAISYGGLERVLRELGASA